MMVSRVLRVWRNIGRSMMLSVGRAIVKVQGLMEAGRSKTEKVRGSDSYDNKCQAELGWDGDQYRRPETGDRRLE
jgi:hypothetical protein